MASQSSLCALVVDDEPMIRQAVAALLENDGYRVLQAESGRQALGLFTAGGVSLVVLDLMLPDLSGEEVCRAIRKSSRVPVVMLTAKAEEADLLDGLAIGADDYIVKPFSLKALRARVSAVMRRAGGSTAPLASRFAFRGGDLAVDLDANQVLKRGVPVPLTQSEMRLLTALLSRPGKAFTRDELIALALGDGFDGFDRAVDSHIKNLRQKIEDDPRQPVYILTVHGLGYRFGGDGDA